MKTIISLIGIYLLHEVAFAQLTNCDSLQVSISIVKDCKQYNVSAQVMPSTGQYQYQWSTGDTGISNINIHESGNYSVIVSNVNAPIGYGPELVSDGNFSNELYNFYSEYQIDSTPPLNEGMYYICSNGNCLLNDWSACFDHTTGSSLGSLMLVNGATVANVKLWCQQISVHAQTYYQFSAWATTVYPNNPPLLQFSINNELLDVPLQASSILCQWTSFQSSWYSGINTSAEICIVNQNIQSGGNDFAIDDISFKEIIYCIDTVHFSISDTNQLAIDYSLQYPACVPYGGASLSIEISGGLAPYSIFINNNEEILPINNVKPGSYHIMITDANYCSIDSIIHITGDSTLMTQNNFPNVISYSSLLGNDQINLNEVFPELSSCVDFNLSIYNRWGVSVFEYYNNKNIPDLACNHCFNGHTKTGEKLTPGTYFFILEIEEEKMLKGTLNIFD